MVSLAAEVGHVNGAYSFLLTLGFAGSLLWLAWGRQDRETLRHVDAALVALAGGLVGARLGFVLTHLGAYVARPLEALWFWQGGLSWAAGALGAVLAVVAFAVIHRFSFWPVADALAVPAALMALVSWTGCLLDGCAYGRRTDAGPFTTPTPDLFGWTTARWPTQAVGIAASTATLIFALWLQNQRLPSGVAAGLVLACLAAGALALAFTRADPVPMLWGLRADAVGSAVVLALSLGMIGARALKR
ncbi:MAG: prolipoprotein diacylglyceryl transferase family protein [Chloroflexota bacterium]